MPHLARGDARLYYEDDGDGPAILMTHGFVASTGMWDGQVTALKDAYRLIRWDMQQPRADGMRGRSSGIRPGHHRRRHDSHP